jgi:hypothetical protein
MGGRVLRGTAGPQCFDDANRYVACSNGTVTDTVTNLVWLADASCIDLPGLGGDGAGTYSEANEAAAQLRDGICGLTDGSRPGDWRLATPKEWEAVTGPAYQLGCFGSGNPSVTDDAGTGCYNGGSGTSFSGVETAQYWTSNSRFQNPLGALVVSLANGSVGQEGKTTVAYAWPARGVYGSLDR